MPDATCTQCGEPVSTRRDSGNYQQVVGFVRLRKKGANEVKLRRNRNIFICSECMGLLMAGHVPGQTSLWIEGE